MAVIFGSAGRGFSALCQAASTPGESRQDAATGPSQPGVVETQWNLIELNGSAVNVPGNEGQVYIYLQQEGDKLSGSDGCNRFFGSYDLSGASLQFHSVAQTLMACRGAFTDREARVRRCVEAGHELSDIGEHTAAQSRRPRASSLPGAEKGSGRRLEKKLARLDAEKDCHISQDYAR